MIPSLVYRDEFRDKIINHVGKGEIWAFHPNYENILVSSYGKVKNVVTDNVYKQRKNYQNYSIVSIVPMSFGDGVIHRSKSKLIHRLVAETFLNYLDTDLFEANHINGNKDDNSIFNVNWLTRKENLKHAVDTGLLKPRKGEKNGRFKYTKQDIDDILEFRSLGYSLSEISKSYGLKRYGIFSVIKRRTKCQ